MPLTSVEKHTGIRFREVDKYQWILLPIYGPVRPPVYPTGSGQSADAPVCRYIFLRQPLKVPGSLQISFRANEGGFRKFYCCVLLGIDFMKKLFKNT
jgi:hypothetical protein